MTSIEENKALVRRFVELENKGDLEALFGMLSPVYVSHYNTGDSTLEDNKKFSRQYGLLFLIFNLHWKI